MNEENVVAVYDTAAHAEAAVRDLHAANVPADAITSHAATAGTAGTATREPGFWGKMLGGEPDHDTSVYDRSLDGGSTIVTVRAPAEHVESVSRILELHEPIDINQRASGYGATTATAPASVGTTAGPDRVPGGADEAIALSEEQLTVGKRQVNRGSTRVHRYVVETPVEQDVTLRSEHVSIERRPASADAHVTGAAFTDQVVEVKETAEEVVVGKTARVKEEVVIRKDVADRVETIHDTVRREDVEITQDGAVDTAGTAPTIAPKI